MRCSGCPPRSSRSLAASGSRARPGGCYAAIRERAAVSSHREARILEIIFLIWFCKKLAAIARGKNRGGGWGALGALFWIGGEITGAILGVSAAPNDTGTMYGYAIGTAILGAVIAFVIVKALPEIPLDTGLPQARIV